MKAVSQIFSLTNLKLPKMVSYKISTHRSTSVVLSKGNSK